MIPDLHPHHQSTMHHHLGHGLDGLGPTGHYHHNQHHQALHPGHHHSIKQSHGQSQHRRSPHALVQRHQSPVAHHHQEHPHLVHMKQPMSVEAWSLELWRAVAVECFATFLFAFVVAGAAIASYAVSGSGLNVMATAVASGFAIAAVQLIFGPVSGGHVNPAVSVSFALSRKVSTLRAALYIAAQCGGGIAGAAMLYGVASTPQTLMIPPSRLSEQALLKLLVELSLSIFVILAHYASDSPTALSSTISAKPACVLAAAYTSATLVSSPFLNPARALGPAFVLNRWENHWVYWIGPIGGGAIAALLNEYVLSGNRGGRGVRRVSPRHQRASSGPDYDDGDNSSSLRSDDEMTYDDSRDKARVHKFAGGGYATYHPVAGSSIYGPGGPISHQQQQAQSHHNSNLERVESIYGGTKSLYCKSPPLTRANLNRSQSVYAKSPSGVAAALRGVDSGLVGGLPKPGPLVPAQSLYPIIRLNSSDATPNGSLRPSTNGPNNASAGAGLLVQPIQPLQQGQNQGQGQQPNYNSLNQNVQNQLAQCTQSIYGIRGITSSSGLGARDNIYGHLAGTPRAVEGIYGRAPAPPPHHQQVQQQMQHQPTRDLQASPSCHVLVPPPQQSPMSNGGGQQATLELRRSAERPESAYGHTRRNGGSGGEDSAYGSYQSSSRGPTYAKGPNNPNTMQQQQQNGLYATASNRPVQVVGNPQQQQHRNSPNPQGQQQQQY